MAIAVIAVLAVSAPAVADAATATPVASVSVTQYSPKVFGSIGERVAGVRVTARLLRDTGSIPTDPTHRLIASATATTAANGSWSLTLAPRIAAAESAVGFTAPGDEVAITYAAPKGHPGTALPTAQTYGSLDETNAALGLGGAVARNGRSLALGEPYCGTGEFLVNGTQYPFSSTPATAPTTSTTTTTTSTTATPVPATCTTPVVHPRHPITNDDYVSLDTSLVQADGAYLNVITPIGLDGVGYGHAGAGAGPPTCAADLTSDLVTCIGLDGDHFAMGFEHQPLVMVHDKPGADGVDSAAATIDGLASGGTLQLVDVTPGLDAHVVSVLHIASLRVNESGPDGAITVARCTPDLSFLAATPTVGATSQGPLCPADGRISGTAVSTAQPSLFDARSGGSTLVTVPAIRHTLPASGHVRAHRALQLAALPTALVINRSLRDQIVAVTLTLRAHSGRVLLKATATPGRADDRFAEIVSVPAGLAAGHDSARWTLTDTHGDTYTDTVPLTVGAG